MIVLASTSITRQALLRNAGVPVTTMRPDVDEQDIIVQNPNWNPAETSLALARAKALDVSRKSADAIVIGADQVLTFRHRIYSKPADIAAASLQLKELRGQTHELITSVSCARHGEEVWTSTGHAHLRMRNFSDAFLESYLARNGENCMSSVGGYQIEGLGSQLFDSVEGDYFIILGLPLFPLMQFLRSIGELQS